MKIKKLLMIFILSLLALPMVFGAIDYGQAVLYYKLNDATESIENTGTLTGTNAGFVTGKVGNAIDLEASSTQYMINTTLNGTGLAAVRTIDFWLNPETLSNKVFEIHPTGSANPDLYFNVEDGTGLRFVLITGAHHIITCANSLNIGTWTHFITVMNSSGAYIFVNGSTTPCASDSDADIYMTDAYNEILFGRIHNAAEYYDGMIDNFYLTKQEYGDDEITESWNGGDGLDFSTGGNTAPAISIISPDNNTYSADTTPEITFLVTDPEEATTDCNIIFDSSPYGSNASVLDGVNTIIGLNASLNNGARSYYINCSDGTDTNISETRTITIDTIIPKLDLYLPLNETITQNQSVIFYYLYEDENLNNCSLYFDTGLNQTNTTPINSRFNNTYVIDDFGDSSINNSIWNYSVNDGDHIVKEADGVMSLWIDGNSGRTWLNTTGKSNPKANTTFEINCLSTDTISGNFNLHLGGVTEGTITLIGTAEDFYCRNYTGIISENSTNLKWYINGVYTVEHDISGLSGGYRLYFRMDENTNDRYMNFTEYKLYNTTGKYNTFQIDNIASGYHNWSIKCYDLAGNSNTSETRSIRVDVTDPTITSYSPDNNSILAWNNNITFDILVNDEGFIYSVQNNITDPDGSLAYTFNYTDIGDWEEQNIRLNGSIKLNINGSYTWDKRVCDGHTTNILEGKLKDPIIKPITKEIDFADFRLIPKDPENIERATTNKLIDKIEFGWDLKEIKKTEYDFISTEKLDYFPRSEYAGHFIIGSKEIWVDFEGLEKLEIKKISDNHYLITTTPKTKEIMVKSSGELNCFSEASYFSINNMGVNLSVLDYSSNSTINNFSAIVVGGASSSTTNGYIEFNLTAGNYTIKINASGYALRNETIEIIGNENLTSYLYKTNSILINIYNEDDGSLINNVDVLFDANSTYYITHSTTNGSMYITNLPTSSYNLKVSSSGYVTRNYQITLTGNNYILQNAYLLNSSNLVVITIKSDETDKFIEGASVILTRRVNGSWVSVGSETTDGVGAIRFGMKEGEEYKLLISAGDYNTREVTLKPYEEAYTIYIIRETEQTFFDLFNKMSYRIMPYKLVIPPSSIPNPITCFNLTTSSAGGYIDFFGLSGTLDGLALNISNITGSPSGGTAEFCLNLTNYNDYNITIDYWIKVSGEDLWENQRQYFISNLTEGSLTDWFSVKDYSATGWLGNYGSELPTTWKVIIMVAVAVGLMLTFAMWLPPMVLGFIGIAVIGVFSFIWFPFFSLIAMILTIVMALMYLIMRGRS